MHSSERLGLRAWLEQVLNSEKYPGVQWIDQSEGMFFITWTHASRRGWTEAEDAAVFRDWAVHTGRYKEGTDKAEPKIWKANFRCAVNASRDIEQIRGATMCNSATRRVFVFTKTRKSKVTVPQRCSTHAKGEKRSMKTAASRRPVRRPNIRPLKTSIKENEHSNDVYAEKCRNLRISLKSTPLPKKTQSITVAQFKKIASEGCITETKSSQSITIKRESKDRQRIAKTNETDGHFSFSELLQVRNSSLAQDSCRNNESSFFSMSPAPSWGISDLGEEFTDLLNFIDPENSPSSSDLDSLDGQSSPPHRVYSPTFESSDSEDMAEVFDDHRDHELSFTELENILSPKSIEKRCKEVDSNRHLNMFEQLNNMGGFPLSSIHAYSFPTELLTSDISDPFLSAYDINEANILKAMVSDS